MNPEQNTLFRQHNPHAYNAIMVRDEYRLKQITHPVRMVFDIGANVGIFTVAAKDRWPTARVVAVEPNRKNFHILNKIVGCLSGIETVCAALGNSAMYFRHGDTSGSHVYCGASCAYSLKELEEAKFFRPIEVETLMLDTLVEKYGQPSLIKVDIEGAEADLIGHEPSHAVMCSTDTIVMELHPWSKDKTNAHRVGMTMVSWLASFFDTHDIDLWLKESGGMVWMKKRAVC